MSFLKKTFNWIFRRFTGYFLKGLLFIAPIGITVYLSYLTFTFLDGLLPFEWPGLSLIIVILGTALLGFVGSVFIQASVIQAFDGILEKIPLVKFIYTSVRDFLSAFVGKEKRFNKPVMVKMNASSPVWKLGFITQHDLEYLGIESGKSAVYLPHSYNFSGNLFIVDNELITPIDAPADEVMKFIVSGGITKM